MVMNMLMPIYLNAMRGEEIKFNVIKWDFNQIDPYSDRMFDNLIQFRHTYTHTHKLKQI